MRCIGPQVAFVALVALSPACGGEPGPGGSTDLAVPCAPVAPRAYVLDHADPVTGRIGTAGALRRAGFAVQPLPLDRSPELLEGELIALGSFASHHRRYAEYLRDHAAGLRAFIARGGVLLQLTQDSERESSPSYLPPELSARRESQAPTDLFVFDAEHPLAAGLAEVERAEVSEGHRDDLAIILPRVRYVAAEPQFAVSHPFREQRGLRVVLAAERDGAWPVLLEGSWGDGRVLLGALHLDKIDPLARAEQVPSRVKAIAARLFRNLCGYAVALVDGDLPDVVPTAPYVQPVAWPFVPDSATLVVLPDTQYYIAAYPEILVSQVEWIRAHATERKIGYVLHVGDIVENNSQEEWRRAQQIFSRLDGHVPYALAAGNHDYAGAPTADGAAFRDTTRINQAFHAADFGSWATFGGLYLPERIENSYHLFSMSGQPWIALALEWAPRDAVVEWADAVLAQHPERLGILVTHAYMYHDESRYDRLMHPGQSYTPYNRKDLWFNIGGINDGGDLWRKLVSRHQGMRFVFSGHVLDDGRGRMTSRGEAGNWVHQMLANYQHRERAGSGYLRLIELLPDGKTVQVRTYSPYEDAYRTGSQDQFRLQL